MEQPGYSLLFSPWLQFIVGAICMGLVAIYLFIRLKYHQLKSRDTTHQLSQKEEAFQQLQAALQEAQSALESKQTQIKYLKEQLLQSEKMASVGLLTAGIAHEINNPINFIAVGIQALDRKLQAYLQATDEETAIQERQKVEILLQDIRTGVTRTTAIVKGLKDFVRESNDTPTLANVHDCIEATLIVLKHNLREIRVEKQLTTTQADMLCFPDKLNQVLLNLLANAAEELQQKEGEKYIRIITQKCEDAFTISVTDNGRGIPESELSLIFEPFFTTKHNNGGTGLGLFISKEIIEQHGGALTVESSVGVGTTFSIILYNNLRKA